MGKDQRQARIRKIVDKFHDALYDLRPPLEESKNPQLIAEFEQMNLCCCRTLRLVRKELLIGYGSEDV